MSCRTVRPWLHVAAEQLSEPDRLVLEEHLQVCERCREERAQLGMIRDDPVMDNGKQSVWI